MTTDAELDRMYEAAVAQDWEEQNGSKWADAIEKIAQANELLSRAAELMKEAADLTLHSGETDRIASLAEEIEFLSDDVIKQKGRM